MMPLTQLCLSLRFKTHSNVRQLLQVLSFYFKSSVAIFTNPVLSATLPNLRSETSTHFPAARLRSAFHSGERASKLRRSPRYATPRSFKALLRYFLWASERVRARAPNYTCVALSKIRVASTRPLPSLA